jgi:hypothetical protein
VAILCGVAGVVSAALRGDREADREGRKRGLNASFDCGIRKKKEYVSIR